MTALWLPILLSAVGVFIMSSLIHMVFQYHNSDLSAVPGEAEVMAALRPFNLPPGDYALPKAANMKEYGSPEFVEKLNQGPVAMLTVFPNGPFAMGKQLTMWFIYCLVVGVFAAYVSTRAFRGDEVTYLSAFRMTGTVAFVGYGLALVQDAIWWGKSWVATAKSVFDALLYALITAGVFGWLWPS